jgi:dTDP-4-dehydrorhamnose 3,5-epimerase
LDEIKTIILDTFETKDIENSRINGKLTVIWRDYDQLIDFTPKMIYLTSVNPGETKGPHLHTKRDSYFVCTEGKVVFIVKNKLGIYEEIESSADNPVMVKIPKGIPSAHITPTKNISSVLALASIAWKPNDDEMKNTLFDDYDWEKWIESE